MKSFITLAILALVSARHHHHHHHGKDEFIQNKINELRDRRLRAKGAFEFDENGHIIVRSTLGPHDNANEHMDFMHEDSDIDQYKDDAPIGYLVPFDANEVEYLQQQHENFLIRKQRDTRIVTVTNTNALIGNSTLGRYYDKWEEQATDGMATHSDTEAYVKSAPVGYDRHINDYDKPEQTSDSSDDKKDDDKDDKKKDKKKDDDDKDDKKKDDKDGDKKKDDQDNDKKKDDKDDDKKKDDKDDDDKKDDKKDEKKEKKDDKKEDKKDDKDDDKKEKKKDDKDEKKETEKKDSKDTKKKSEK